MTNGQSDNGAQVDLTSFDEVFSSHSVAQAIAAVSRPMHDAARGFWRVPFVSPHLNPRMKELILFAMHASAPALNATAIDRQVKRVLAAGGTKSDMLDVLTTITGLANHALYACVPVLLEEMSGEAGVNDQSAEALEKLERAKQHFIDIRGFWNSDRDPISKAMPEYFSALTNISVASWEFGALSRKEREFVCIGIDCTVAHTYLPGLRIHIRNAIREGATRDEILEIFQLAAMMGLEGYVMACESIFTDEK